MTAVDLRKAADHLENLDQGHAAYLLNTEAVTLERDATKERIMRRTLERLTVPITVRAGDVAALLHWVSDNAWLTDAPVPNGVLELHKKLADTHMELIGEPA